MNSFSQSKLRYEGRPHQKKVSMFLNQSIKKLKNEVTNSTNDRNSYCDIWKTWFKSQTDASQHYAGKKHIKAALGQIGVRNSSKIKKTSLNGHFATQNQTTTQISSPAVPLINKFIPKNEEIMALPITNYPATLISYPKPLTCDICRISVNRPDQLESHYKGARHIKAMSLQGFWEIEPESEVETAAVEIDYSIHKTPPGQYYCSPCNMSLNSEASFDQHMESRKHKYQVNLKPPQPVVTSAKKN